MKQRENYRAAALKYNSEKDKAPKVVASGSGEVGQRIIELAKENGIPMHKDPALVETLAALELGQEIPVELYQAVAEIFTFVYRLDREERESLR